MKAGHVFAIILIYLVSSWEVCSSKNITLYGACGSRYGGWEGLPVYLSTNGNPKIAVRETSGSRGEWAIRVENPGTYAVAVEDALGFGPIIRPGVEVSEKRFNRVNLLLNFQYDLKDQGIPASEDHVEYGQTFKAEGTSITGIVFKDADRVLISMHEENRFGRQVGKTVKASSFYPHGTLPTIPGRTYYLKFVRDDGKPFKMHLTSDDRYKEGTAFLDGKRQEGVDLAITIQYTPSGQILRTRPSVGEASYSAKQTFGQTFVAKGTSLGMIDVFVAEGDKPYTEPTIRLLEGGPGGKQIGPVVIGRLALFNPNEVPLVPGQTYYIEISKNTSADDLRLWVEKNDTLEGGQLYIDSTAIPEKDLSMILVEYEADKVPPPPVSNLKRYPCSRKVKLVWDTPASNDICRVLIYRRDPSQRASKSEGDLVANIPLTSQGKHHFVDTNLKNGVSYEYLIRTADYHGNLSAPVTTMATPLSGIPATAELLNADFADHCDFGIPYGWEIDWITGWYPDLRIDTEEGGANAPLSAGWCVQEGKQKADMALYQRVMCEKNRRYQLSAEVRLWNPWDSWDMLIYAMVGIDPTGGTDPLGKSVLWSSPSYNRKQWTTLSISAAAKSDYITVFLRGYSEYSRVMNTRFRNVKLEDVTDR
jgi:hypothetical protein